MIEAKPRAFTMYRASDISGVSGTGPVLDGIQWPDGRVATRWRGTKGAGGTYDSIEDFDAIHIASHPTNGTRIEWH